MGILLLLMKIVFGKIWGKYRESMGKYGNYILFMLFSFFLFSFHPNDMLFFMPSNVGIGFLQSAGRSNGSPIPHTPRGLGFRVL